VTLVEAGAMCIAPPRQDAIISELGGISDRAGSELAHARIGTMSREAQDLLESSFHPVRGSVRDGAGCGGTGVLNCSDGQTRARVL
jgi:hypothetical protein